jgi:hypothetical protein
MTYSNMMVATHLTVLKKGWSVTVISISSIFVTSLMMLIFVPLGRRLLGEGGECAGAASAVIGSEAVTLVAMLTRYPRVPLDKRNIRVFAKTAAVAAVTLLLNHQLRFLGPILRLVIDAFVYAGLALALGLVRIQDIQFALRLIRRRGGNEANAATAIAEG